MKLKIMLPLVCLSVLPFTGLNAADKPAMQAPVPKTVQMPQKEALQKVYTFIKGAGHYYIATVEGDQPRVRPFGTVHIYKDRLYIQTGKHKAVSRQIGANGKVEICALKDGKWVRVSGTLVNDDSKEAKASLLDEYPSLKSMYDADDPNTQVLYFTNGTATFYSFSGDPELIRF